MRAVVVLSKCGKSHKTYGMRAEERSTNNWVFTWAFPIKESRAKQEGYDQTSIDGTIDYADEFPGCPYCGGKQFTVCSCGHMGCTIVKNNVYTCEWCGEDGYLSDYNGESIDAGMNF